MDHRIPASPQLTWSHTRARTLDACPRRYYLRYYRAHGGWRADAPAGARRAYRLAQLTTLDLVLGTSVHRRAGEVVRAVIGRRSLPSSEDLLRRTWTDLNGAWRNSRNLRRFAADPKGYPALLEIYYGRGIPQEQIERIREKAHACVRGLLHDAPWADLATCRPGAVHVVDTLVSFSLADTTVWVAPDLVYTRPDGRSVIVDWKSGRSAGPDLLDQLLVYGLYAADALHLPLGADGYLARAVLLPTGEVRETDLTADDLARTRARIGESIARMLTLQAVAIQRHPHDADVFPLTRQRALCGRCPFWELCEPELYGSSAAGPAATHGTESEAAAPAPGDPGSRP